MDRISIIPSGILYWEILVIIDIVPAAKDIFDSIPMGDGFLGDPLCII